MRSGFFRPLEPRCLNSPAPDSGQTVLNEVERGQPLALARGPALPFSIPKGSRLRKPHRVCDTAEGSAQPDPTSAGAEGGGGTGAALDTGGPVISPTPLSAPQKQSATLFLSIRGSSLLTSDSSVTSDLAEPAVVSACAWKARPLPEFYQMGCRGGEGQGTCFL